MLDLPVCKGCQASQPESRQNLALRGAFQSIFVQYFIKESCRERMRVTFKTNQAAVNHSKFQPIPKHFF